MSDIAGDAAAAAFQFGAMATTGTSLDPWVSYGAILAPVVADVLERALSPRQRSRVQRLGSLADKAVIARINGGEAPRADGFFEREPSGRNAGAEAIEAVLNLARDSYEELKLPFIANLLAAITFDTGLTSNVANRLIVLAEQLTWTQYVLLAAIERRESIPVPDVMIGGADLTSWEGWAVHRQLVELRERDLIAAHNAKTAVGVEYTNWTLTDQQLVRGGRLLHNVLRLGDIGPLDVASVWRSAEL